MIAKILQKPYLASLYTLFIFGLCVMPSENIPEEVDDKLAHFVAFAGISFLWLWVKPEYLKVILAAILFGFFIEFTQGALPKSFHRSYDNYDGLADAIGVIIGAGFYFVSTLILGTKKGSKAPF
jgi:VanZ family protein